MNKNERITFRTSLELKSALMDKAESLRMTLSDLIEFMVKEHHEKAEGWKQHELDKEDAVLILRGVKLRRELYLMEVLVSKINAVKANGVTWPIQTDELLNRIVAINKEIRADLNKYK